MTLRLVASNGELVEDAEAEAANAVNLDSDLPYVCTRIICDIIDGIIGVNDYRFSAYWWQLSRCMKLPVKDIRRHMDILVERGILTQEVAPHGRRQGVWRVAEGWTPRDTWFVAPSQREV